MSKSEVVQSAKRQGLTHWLTILAKAGSAARRTRLITLQRIMQ